MLAAAVRRGLRTPFLVGDLPFGSYEVSDEQAVRDRVPLRQGGGLRRRQARGRRPGRRSRAPGRSSQRRHPGHGPRRPDAADVDRAGRLQGAGPQRRAARRRSPTRRSRSRRPAASRSSSRRSRPRSPRSSCRTWTIPVIGIGAGPATDGQVLVFHDLLGIREGLGARFVKRYANLQDEMAAGVAAYAADVRSRAYPAPEHGYSIDEASSRRSARRSHAELQGDVTVPRVVFAARGTATSEVCADTCPCWASRSGCSRRRLRPSRRPHRRARRDALAARRGEQHDDALVRRGQRPVAGRPDRLGHHDPDPVDRGGGRRARRRRAPPRRRAVARDLGRRPAPMGGYTVRPGDTLSAIAVTARVP